MGGVLAGIGFGAGWRKLFTQPGGFVSISFSFFIIWISLVYWLTALVFFFLAYFT